MKKNAILVSLVALVLLAGCGPGRYVPVANEEIYGTWIHEGLRWQKLVVFAGGTRLYVNVADADPAMETTDQIIAKWKDADGNTWYNTFDRWLSGQLKGMKSQYLWEIRNGSQIELTGEFVKDFSEKSFPLSLKSDPLADHRTYQRSPK